MESRRHLVEEIAVQCDEISKLHPSSINTIPQKTIDQQILELKQQYGNPFC